MAGCTPILKDPSGHFWILGVLDSGILTTTYYPFTVSVQANPILISPLNSTLWQLSADNTGHIVSTYLPTLPKGGVVRPYIPMLSPGFLTYALGVNPAGYVQTTSSAVTLPDTVPYPFDITMSIYGNGNLNPPVICPVCANATVTVSADLSCWCCGCASFVRPEDTTIVVILSE